MIMRRFINLLVCVGLVGAGAIYLASCAAQKGPLSPNTSLLGLTSPGTSTKYLQATGSSVTSPVSVSQTAKVFFNAAVNPSTLNASTVLIYTMSTDGLSETQYTNFVISYDAANRALVLSPDPNFNSGFWQDNTNYRVVLTTGITSVTGAQLDGNGNGIPESQEFDNFIIAMYTGVPSSPGYTTGNVSMSGLSVKYFDNVSGNTVSASILAAGSGLGNINAALPVTITATFNMPLNPATIWAGSTALSPNMLFTSNGAVVAPTSVTLTGANNVIEAYFSNLSPNTQYQLVFKGGLTGIQSSLDAWLTLLRGFYFDGNGSYGDEASDDSKPRFLATRKADDSTAKPPYLNNANVTYDSTNNRWIVVFQTPSGNNKMDPATLNGSNVIMYSGSSTSFTLTSGTIYGSITPKEIFYDFAANTLYVYMPSKFVPRPNYTYAYVKLMITRNVKSADGYSFDGNIDGVGGTTSDDRLFGNAGTTAVQVYTAY